MTLTLPEEVMLLALKDDKGTTVSGAWYTQALGGAILSELLLAGRVEVETTKKKMVNLVDGTPVGDALLDNCLEKVATAKRRKSAQNWVATFGNTKNLKHTVAMRLVDKQVLRADEDRILGIFKRRIYPELNPGPERAIVTRLRDVVLGEGRVDPRTVVLVAIANVTGLLKTVLDKQQLKARKDRIKRVTNGDVTAAATKEAVQAVQAAVMVAVILPTIMTTTVTSH